MSSVFAYIKWLFGFLQWPDLSTEEGRKDAIKILHRRLNFIIYGSVLIIVIYIYILFTITKQLPDDILNLEVNIIEFLTLKKSLLLSDLLWICILLFFALCIASISISWGIKKKWASNFYFSEEYVGEMQKITDLLNQRYELDNRRCAECEKYSHSMKLLSGLFENMSHEDFIRKFTEFAGLQTHNPEQLNIIISDFENQKRYAKLLCLLTNPQYYQSDDSNSQLKSLTFYFIGFSPLINKNKRVKRIFSLSAIGEKEKTDSYKFKAKCLFQYLLTNYISGVETCLLIDDNDLRLHIDYVVGKYPGEIENLYSKRISYLSYENKTDKKKDYMVKTSDQLFTNILESDFYNRWKGKKSNGRTRKRIEIAPGCWKQVIEELSIKDTSGNNLIFADHDIDEIFTNVAICIKDCEYDVSQKEKNQLFKKLKKEANKESYVVSFSKTRQLSDFVKTMNDFQISTKI